MDLGNQRLLKWKSEYDVKGRTDDSRLKFMEDQMGTLQSTLTELVRLQRGVPQSESDARRG
jgi:hypothetical protein